jgi:lysophospholipase L1-like esterase
MRKLLPLLLGLFLPALAHAQYTGPTTGQKVAFLGDSITAQGAGKPSGYVRLVEKTLEAQGNKIEVIPAGVSGNTSKDMIARLDASVLSKKPDWMTLSCGVNDVWHGANGVDLPTYQKNITEIVEKAQAAGIKVTILTSTMITEDPNAETNKKLADYNEFLHTLAKEKNLPIADLNAAMQAELAEQKAKLPQLKGTYLTVDGVHMNPLGNQMMATGILKAWGVTDAQIAEASKSWDSLDSGVQLSATPGLTVAQYLKLRETAASQGKSPDELVSDMVKKDLETIVGPIAPPAPTPAPTPPPAKQ